MREGGHGSLLRLGANESNFGPSPKAVQAMAAELPRISWYGDPESYKLRVAVAARHGCGIDNVCVGSGIDDLMGLTVRAFMSPGSIALATLGTYPTFAYHVMGFGGELATVPYRPDGTVDVEALAQTARRLHPAIVYIANPDNPGGTYLALDEIERLFESLPGESLLFLDEAYADFVSESDGCAPHIHPGLIRARTFSKAYGMAGARIGYAICAPRTVRTFEKIRLQYGVNRNAQIGALAALADVQFHRYVVEQVARGREDYYALAESLGCDFVRSHTNFVCIGFGSAAEATGVMNALLARAVFVRKPGAPPLDRFVRISVGTPPEREALAEHLRAVTAERTP